MEAAGADVSEDRTDSSSLRLMSLCSSCEAGDLKAISRLIGEGADINGQAWYNGATVIYLLQKKSETNPTWAYVEVDRGKLCRFHSDNGLATARSPEFYGTVLKKGPGQEPDTATVTEMENYKRVVSENKTEKDLTPLHVAVLNGHLPAIEMLLQRADPNIRDKFGYNPVQLAASQGKLDMIQMFQLRRVNAQDFTGEKKRLKEIAAENGHHHIVKYLTDKHLIESALGFNSGPVQDTIVGLQSVLDNYNQERYREREPSTAEIRSDIVNMVRPLLLPIDDLLKVLEAEPKDEEVRLNLTGLDADGLALKIGSSTE